MLDRFKKFVDQNSLFTGQDRILLGFSGGPDSVALAHLLVRYGVTVGLAHVNFHLRGVESDRDQAFSREFASRHGLEFFTIDFDTVKYAREKGLSIEEAARNLRYQWFEELARSQGYDFIATAHNADDNVETILHNLARGTGIKGLLGIPLKRGKVIRPLLFAYKRDVLRYCQQHGLNYVVDKTNMDTAITRNRIRHNIIPEFEKINPGFKDNVLRTANNLRQVYGLVLDYVSQCREKIMKVRGKDIIINKKDLENCGHKEIVIYNLLSDLGFSPGNIDQFWLMIQSQPGKQVQGKGYTIVNDRGEVIITPVVPVDSQDKIVIQRDTREARLGDTRLLIEVVDVSQVNWRNLPSNEAALDYARLEFPVILRHWQEGDYFYPLGMRGRKKLSDFFVDQKISIVDKKKIWVLESAGKIAWVVGMRIDDRFKITDSTTKVLKLTLR